MPGALASEGGGREGLCLQSNTGLFLSKLLPQFSHL